MLQKAAVGLAAASALLWLALGPNLGWTKTTVTRWQKDPVTEIDGPIIEKRFVPGIDLLAICFTTSVALFAGSFFVRKSSTANP